MPRRPPPPPPKRKLPQASPAATPAATGSTTPQPAPPGTPPAGPSGGQAQPGAAPADANSDATNTPTPGQAEAGGAGDNTTDPNGDVQPNQPPPDTTPLRFAVEDEPGQAEHTIAIQGAEALHALMLGVQQLHTKVPPEMFEQVGMAATHLADAYRQANFGQHEGAVTSMGHAAAALDRARQVPHGDPAASQAASDAYDAAVNVGNGIRQMNQSPAPWDQLPQTRPSWNPVPQKQWKGLPVTTVEWPTGR